MASSGTSSGGSGTSPSAESTSYDVKWICWNDDDTAIIMQNKNGPCPLIALFNVLLLSKRITLLKNSTMITSERMIAHIGELMLEDMPSDLSEAAKVNYEQNIFDAMQVCPKLLTGIDVNIQYKTVKSFECTSEQAVFDLLRINLYHGWLPDPQDKTTYAAVHNYSYNQIVDKIISSKDEAENHEKIQEGLIAEEFIQNTASQLTCYGVISILEQMRNDELAILFRNNHFSTMCKKNNEIFTLVTDRGFLSKKDIVWETMSSVQGDSHFTNSRFVTSPTEMLPSDERSFEILNSPQVEEDYQVALRLQQQENERHNRRSSNPASSSTAPRPSSNHSRQQTSTVAGTSPKKKSGKKTEKRTPTKDEKPQDKEGKSAKKGKRSKKGKKKKRKCSKE